MSLSRRDLLSAAGSVAVWSLCELAFSRRALASTVAPVLGKWLREVNDIARSLENEALSQAGWQSQMDALYRRVPFSDLLRLVDVESLERHAPLPAVGESFEELALPRIEGLPARPAFYRVVAGFRAGRSIPPHAHNHLVSSFLVLQGELHGRHFDRVRDLDGDRISIRATSDRSFGPGDSSTVSQDRNNVHWFTATKDHSFVLDLGVGGLAPAGAVTPLQGQHPNKMNRIYLDVAPDASVPGTLSRARRVSEADAYRIYG